MNQVRVVLRSKGKFPQFFSPLELNVAYVLSSNAVVSIM